MNITQMENIIHTNKSPFTDLEREILKGISSKLALKRNTTKTYVNKIISGERKIHTEKSVTIYKDLLAVLNVLTIKVL